MARRLVRLRRSTSSPVLTFGATLFCLALFAFLEVRSEFATPAQSVRPLNTSASALPSTTALGPRPAAQIDAAQVGWAQAAAERAVVAARTHDAETAPAATKRIATTNVTRTAVERRTVSRTASTTVAAAARRGRPHSSLSSPPASARRRVSAPPPAPPIVRFVKTLGKPFGAFWRSLKRGPNETRASRAAAAHASSISE